MDKTQPTAPHPAHAILNKGSSEIEGLVFSYELLKLKEKKTAPLGHVYLKVVLPFSSMSFSATGLIKIATAQSPETFYNACRQMLAMIIKNEDVLTQSLPDLDTPTETN